MRMEKKIFVDVYEDKQFREKVNAMLASMYYKHKKYFNDSAIDLEDFIQEIWCELFEEKRFCPDRAWCYDSMKCNAMNYCRDIKNRFEIAPIVSFIESED